MNPTHQYLAFIAVFLVCVAEPSHAQQGRTIEVTNRTQLVTAANNAQPGTRIRIAPGVYRGGLTFSDLHGTKGNPIILEARDPNDAPIIAGGASGIQLRSPAYVELRHLVLRDSTGNGLNIDDGGNPNHPAHHIVLEGLKVQDVGPKGNRDGIKLSGVNDFVVKDCTVERWGDSGSAVDMVGCHNGTVESCQFRYRGDILGNGVQTKGGTASIRILKCRFDNAGGRAINLGGSTGRDYFRPRDANYEAKDITVEDCTFMGSMSPIAFVGVDGATVRYNTIYRPTRWVIRILQESQGSEFVPCRNGVFSNNIIAFRSSEARTIVNVGGGTSPETFRFAENYWYCIDNPQRSDRLALPTAEADGYYGLDPLFRDPEHGDLTLKGQSPVRDAGVRGQLRVQAE